MRRSGWTPSGDSTIPYVVATTCNGHTVTFRRWRAAYRMNMLDDRSGFIRHAFTDVR